ncbi:MAG: RNA methyltransferase [Candidatus Dependentiae bacterium]|nr:RNA methyltransferase [Candidatus Dependentiae bacterium]
MKTITSLINPDIKYITSLHSAKGRAQHNQFIAEGVRVCQTLLDSSVKLSRLYATHAMVEQAKLIAPEERIVAVSAKVMEKISTSVTPSGIMGVFAIPKPTDLSDLGSGVVLAQISDPGNMGTLIRSAAALGAGSVVVVEGADIWNPKVIQASAGTLGAVKIFRATWQELLEHKKDLMLHALVVEGGKSPETINKKNCLLVVGNEAHGIPAQWLGQCDEEITLSMPGKIESLNAAVAGSIAMYQVFAR